MDAITQVPTPANEPVHDYAPQSPERTRLRAELSALADHPIDLPHVIGGNHRMGDGERIDVVQPHRHAATLGTLTNAVHADATAAIEAAMAAKMLGRQCLSMSAPRCSCGPPTCWPGPWREKIAAATMLGPVQVGLPGRDRRTLRADRLLAVQRGRSPDRSWRSSRSAARGNGTAVDYRPLDGFVYAITPFNFTSIAGNLPTAPALMGNTVVWKPSITQTLSAYLTMQLLEAAGLPPGVINMVTGDGLAVSDVALADPRLAGIHFTGSTATFQHLWQQVGANIGRYHSYPRLVGETGGKDFVVAHASARPDVLCTALIRGAFDYQGQKCSAASRAFIPHSVWQRMGDDFLGATAALRYGDITDLTNYGGALIDARAFAKNVNAIERAKGAAGVTIAVGGEYDDSVGYFVRPTVLLSDDPTDEAFATEYFGPLLSVHVYPDDSLRANPRRHRHRIALRADRRGHRRRPPSRADRAGPAAVRRRKLLRQRQADRGRGRAPAVRGFAWLGHQRQGRVGAESAALDVGADHQGDVRPGNRPHLPAHGIRLMAGVFANTLRPAIMAASRRPGLRRAAEGLPVTRGWCTASCRGRRSTSALDSVAALRDSGRYVSIDYLGEDVTNADDADAAVRTYLDLIEKLGRCGDPADAGVRPLEVSVKLSALGQSLQRDGDKIARENAWAICDAAAAGGRVGDGGRREPHHHRFDAVASSATCVPTSAGWARFCRPTCGARWAIARSSPLPGPGSGCARAPTTSRHPWPTETLPRSPTRT